MSSTSPRKRHFQTDTHPEADRLGPHIPLDNRSSRPVDPDDRRSEEEPDDRGPSEMEDDDLARHRSDVSERPALRRVDKPIERRSVEDRQSESDDEQPRPKKRFRFRRPAWKRPQLDGWKEKLAPWKKYWPAAAVVGPLLVLWLIPWLIAHSPIVTWMINRSTSDLNGSVAARSASLGWFSPVVLYGVEIRDEQNQPVAEIERLSGDKALLALMFDSGQLGRFKLDKPQLNLVLRDDGSNLEDLLAKYLDPSAPSAATDATLEIVDGTVTIEDARTRRTWQLEKVQMTLAVPDDQSKPVAVSLACVAPDQSRTGQLELEMAVHRGKAGDKNLPADSLKIAAESFPLAPLDPLLRRFAGMEAAGRVTGNVQVGWDHDPEHGRTSIEGKCSGEDLSVASPALGRDRPSLRRLSAGGKAVWQDGRLQCDRVAIDSDVGKLSMTGALDWREASGNRMATFLKQNCELQGNVDLAKLAAVLPSTLRVQQGTQVTSGQLQLSLVSAQRKEGGYDGMHWQGRIEASNLQAVNGTRKIVWQQPILVTLVAHEGSQGAVIENLQCESNFLRLRVTGTANLLTATATFDLSRLADQSAGFVDLGGLKLAGEGTAQLNWERLQEEHFEAAGELRVQNFQWGYPERSLWTEDTLLVNATASGRTDFQTNTRLDSASVRVDANGNVLSARLVRPVAGFDAAGQWPLDVQSRGQLARWRQRLGVWFDLSGWKLDGAYELASDLTIAPGTISVKQAKITATDLVVEGPSLAIREPKVELTATGRWDRNARRLDLELANLTSSAVALQATQFIYAVPAQGNMRLSGTVKCSAVLERLQPWFTGAQPPWRFGGRFTGQTDIQQVGSIVSAQFGATINDFVAQNASGQKFNEREIRLAGRGNYNDMSRSFQIDQAELASTTVGVTGAGKVSRTAGQTDMQLNGKVQYDFERITQLLRSRFGEGIRMAGKGNSPIGYRGPLAGEQATANGSFAWDWADVYGFQVGPGEMQATYNRGTVDVKPLTLAVNEGRVQLAPKLLVSPGPMELVLPPGRVVDQVRINPAMAASGLQYILPVLAGIASAEGRFSIDLEGCRIPIDAPAKGELAGRVTVHSVQLGPGYLLQAFGPILGRVGPIGLQREGVISFRMVDGRIYHRDLELVFPDVTIRTYGSVGLDQSLAMMAEMPIPPNWLAHPVLGPALKGQVIKLPITGTLAQPKIDRRALDDLSKQFMQNAAQNAVQDQLNKGIDRLLKPAPKR